MAKYGTTWYVSTSGNTNACVQNEPKKTCHGLKRKICKLYKYIVRSMLWLQHYTTVSFMYWMGLTPSIGFFKDFSQGGPCIKLLWIILQDHGSSFFKNFITFSWFFWATLGFCKVYPWRTRRFPVETRGFCWKHHVLEKHRFFPTRGEPVEYPWLPVEKP